MIQPTIRQAWPITEEEKTLEALGKAIEEQTHELSQLEEGWNKHDSDAKRWAEERDALHQRIKELRSEAGVLREKRDKLNEEVQELKRLREEAHQERREKNPEIVKTKKKIEALEKKKDKRNMHNIAKEIESLEWKIQTTAYTLEEEKQLAARVGILEGQLQIHERVQELQRSLVQLLAEERALQTKAQMYHERLSQLAEESQSFHEQVLQILEKAQSLQARADEAHQKYVQSRQKACDLSQKCRRLRDQIKISRERIREAEEKKRAKRETELRKELEEKALEKLKRGEKLTWEEFQVLSEKGLI